MDEDLKPLAITKKAEHVKRLCCGRLRQSIQNRVYYLVRYERDALEVTACFLRQGSTIHSFPASDAEEREYYSDLTHEPFFRCPYCGHDLTADSLGPTALPPDLPKGQAAPKPSEVRRPLPLGEVRPIETRRPGAVSQERVKIYELIERLATRLGEIEERLKVLERSPGQAFSGEPLAVRQPDTLDPASTGAPLSGPAPSVTGENPVEGRPTSGL